LTLEFVMYMQAPDGEYYNFVTDTGGTVNVDGPTSYKDWGWWAARGQWALARGVAVFAERDAQFAARLTESYRRGEAALDAAIGEVGRYEEVHGERLPGWLIKDGTDVSALALLGLAEYHAADPNPTTRRLAFALGQGVAEARLGDARTYPFGLRPSTLHSPGYWHGWGAHTVEALARAGEVFGRDDWLRAAAAEADTWFTRLVVTGPIREIGVLPRRYDQIAYAQNMLVSGFAALADATGDDEYRRLAGLAAAWFFGDNPPGVAMYDPESGRVFDGINGANELMVNRNAGAESTIEGLLALLAVADDPVAAPLLDAVGGAASRPLVVEAEQGVAVSGDPGYELGEWTGEAYYSGGHYRTLGGGDAIELAVVVAAADDYDVYAAHERRAAASRDTTVTAVPAPSTVTIDGELDEWGDVAWIAVDEREQILRGAAAWPGPEEASFSAAITWDDAAIHVAADVRALGHRQDGMGADVWDGDALWLYLDTTGTGTRIDAKLTLAETPDGPQVWNWVAGGFHPDATLAWQATPTGYVYEASIPWRSLHRDPPAPGDTLGFDAGIGFAGGFINWTGTDPDTPGNLAPLQVVDERPAPDVSATDDADHGAGLRVELVGLTGTLATVTSPDRDHLWLDRVLGPVALGAGEHRIVVSSTASDPAAESVVDALWLHPVRPAKEWTLGDGTTLRLELDTATGQRTWTER